MAIYFPNQNIQEISSQINVTGGTIVQMVETRSTATVTCNNWSTANFLFSATITPQVATNKILVYAFVPFRMDVAAGNWSLGYINVYRGLGTTYIMGSGWNGTWRKTISSWEKQYLDSPGSTATQTYAIYVYNYPSGPCVHNNNVSSSHEGYAYLRMTEIST